jgi:dTDP-4-dehydrorhamnose 3,5-epimerase
VNFLPTELPDVVVVEPKVFGDERGFFLESFQAKKFAEAGLPDRFVQQNRSRSAKGVLRGLHYQLPPHAQGKLVHVAAGEVFDVAVDVRRSSPTFGKWVAATLSAENHRALYLPPGFAHGFYVLSDTADVEYEVTDFWSPPSERSIRWNDPTLGVAWPITTPPILSPKDAAATLFGVAEVFA